MKAHLLSFNYSDLSIFKEIFRCFSPVRVYIPWGANFPDCKNDEIIVSYPPEGLMPGINIKNLLNEYYSLAQELGEKSHNKVISRGNSASASDESIRSIMASLRGRSSTERNERDRIIRCHMLLHLADRFEKERNEAEKMIVALRKRKSPLLNIAELNDNAIYPFETLAGMDAETFINDVNLRQLLTAWHTIFGEYICEGDLLLFMKRSVFTLLCDGYKYLGVDKGLQLPSIISCKIPLIQVQNDKSDVLEEIVAIFSALKSGGNSSGLTDLLSGYDAGHCTVKGMPYIHISMLYMNIDLVKKDTLLSMFSGRILVFAVIINPPE